MKATKLIQLKAKGNKGEVEAVIATLNVKDHDQDVTLPGFFGKQHVSIVTAHDWRDVMLGKGVIEEEDDKAVFKGQFNMSEDDPQARQLFSRLVFDMEHPPAKIEWSYSLFVKEGGRVQFTDDEKFGDGFWLGPVDGEPGVVVDEVSPVLLGAGVETGTVGVKAKKGETISILESLAEMGDEEAKEMLALHEELSHKDETQRFIDQLEQALASLKKVGVRAEEIMEKRPLGVESREQLAHISLEAKSLGERVAVLTVVTDEDLLTEILRFRKLESEMMR